MLLRTIELSDKDDIKSVMSSAFGGSPWFEVLNDSELERRWNSYIERPGFVGMVLVDHDKLIAAIWWDTPAMINFASERGEDIASWIKTHGFNQFVWIRELVVCSEYQGRGLATFLRNEFISKLDSNTLVLTRHRNDNHGIIAVSKKQGFARVGIRIPSNSNPEIFHEYWYKVV